MRVVLAVGGSIAAYKACDLTSRLVKASYDVRVVMTEAACQFVAPLTFSALSGHPVGVRATDEPLGSLSHVKLARWADAMIVAPASQHLMARMAAGLADDMATLVYFGFRGPVVVAPAMEPEMWAHPRTQQLAEGLHGDGVRMVGPETGRTASGLVGEGRMAEPETIMGALADALTPKSLTGAQVLVTAGPTWEHFDPVRVLTNPSTGRMGALVALEAARHGAQVTLIHGPRVAVPDHPAIAARLAVSAEAMRREVDELASASDAIVGAAAVSDFRPAQPSMVKAHKDALSSVWQMAPNPDIMGGLGRRFRGQKFLVGFAAETHDVVESASRKVRQKNLDVIVANEVGSERGFGDLPHQAHLVWSHGEVETLPPGDKARTARAVVEAIARWYQDRQSASHE